MLPALTKIARFGRGFYITRDSALSAAHVCDEIDAKLHAFVSPRLDRNKILRLKECKSVILHVTSTPRKDAFQFSKENGLINLRASSDDKALAGYKEIAFELLTQLEKVDQLFVPTSSGATLIGIFQGFKERGKKVPALYAVQTARVHPMASYFDKDFTQESVSYATSIVDNIARRKDEVIKILKESGGGGFIISNSELLEARKVFEQSEAECALGWQSLLSFAGFLKWRKQSVDTKKKISVCICTD
ncbi:MAG: pyridoxal-phosphate dependent enzyme [Candidatus Spechtbacteria bacterium]|nr:pyridoxal-phosphate dependent enzyme [Candidatus Spechtbacteria bacterium]